MVRRAPGVPARRGPERCGELRGGRAGVRGAADHGEHPGHRRQPHRFLLRRRHDKEAELEAVGVRGSGVRLQRFDDGSTLREAPGLFTHGFIFDPWGTRIELVEDQEYLGFHHVHLSATDPEATLAWYRDVLGGEPASLRGRLDGLLFGDVWVLASAHPDGVPATTAGRAIDHVAFVVPDLDDAAGNMRQHNVTFLQDPAVPENARTSAKRALLVGPDNVRVAVVEAGFAGVVTERAALATDAREPYDAPKLRGERPISRASGRETPRTVYRWSARSVPTRSRP